MRAGGMATSTDVIPAEWSAERESRGECQHVEVWARFPLPLTLRGNDDVVAQAGEMRIGASRAIVHGMNERVRKLTEEIRKLTPEEQADIMDELLVLTHGQPLPRSDKAWAEEIDRRIDAVERGEVVTVDAREALSKYKKP